MGRQSRLKKELRLESEKSAVARASQSKPVVVAKYLATYLVGFMVFQLVYYEWIVESHLFSNYLSVTAAASAALLRLLGEPVANVGGVLHGSYSLSIK